jgi:hypothetical protein
VSDHPFPVPARLRRAAERHLDAEGKIPRALEILGPLAGRDVVLLEADGSWRCRQLLAAGARVTVVAPPERAAALRRALGALAVPSGVAVVPGTTARTGLPSGSADVAVCLWSGFRGGSPEELAETDRLLRPSGRLLVVHEYARDDVGHLRPPGTRQEALAWSRRDGWFLANGFKIRVVHAFWTFPDLERMRAFCTELFGPGVADADVLLGARRPRLAWKVVVYHRDRTADEALATSVS